MPVPRRQAAAAQLARLAAAGVPGPHPDQWWGLPELSDDRPLVDTGYAGHRHAVHCGGVQRCGLRWLLERHGGGNPPTPEQGIGNLVHAAAMLADDADRRPGRAGRLRGRPVRRDRAVRALAGRPGTAAGRGDARQADRLAGRQPAPADRDRAGVPGPARRRLADRGAGSTGWSVDDAGRLVVIDLKTGKSAPTEAELRASMPQLAAYQAAVEAGAFAESAETGGAALVQLGGDRVSAREQGAGRAGRGGRPGLGAGHGPADRRRRWPRRRSRPWPTTVAGSARCAPPARSPAMAAR